MAKRDYYEILSVTKTATDGDIKAAYRKLALKYHPDRNPGDKEAEEQFKAASEAYEILSNGEKRQLYDRFGHQGVAGQGFQDVGDIFSSFGSIFEEFFGFSSPGFGGGSRRTRPRRGEDLRYDMRISFEEAVFGVEREIEYQRTGNCTTCKGSGSKGGEGKTTCKTCQGAGQIRRNQGFFSVATPCPTCDGSGEMIKDPCTSCRGRGVVAEKKNINVKVPAGVDNGLRLRVTGEGESGANGGPFGDLYVILEVEESDRFNRDGEDLITAVPIGIAHAALGGPAIVQTMDGERTLQVPAGVQHGHRLTISGLGVPHLRGVGRGDLHVEVAIVTPKKLTKEQKEILKKFQTLGGDSPDTNDSGFFQKLFS